MRFVAFLAAYLLSTVVPVTGAAEGVTAPACGIQCIAAAVSTSTCSLTNTTCICTNEKLMVDITTCVDANCTIIERLETQKFSFDNCSIEGNDRRHTVMLLNIAFTGIGLVAYGLRCMERLRMRTWGLDDWVVTLVVLILIPLGGITLPLKRHGLGLDMWNVDQRDISAMLYFFWWGEIFYALSLPLLKISALSFYLKVFPQKHFRYCCHVLIALHVGYAIAFSIAIIVQCSPINGAWLGWTGEYSAKCASLNGIGWSSAAINIFLDLITIFLPVPQLLRLNMSIQKKLLLLLMFAVGLFVTVVSAIRLKSLIVVGSTTNVTQDNVAVAYWSVIEVSVGVVCVCMPSIRALLAHIISTLFGTGSSKNTSSEYGYQSSRNHGVSSRPQVVVQPVAISTRGQQQRDSHMSGNHSAVELVSIEKSAFEA